MGNFNDLGAESKLEILKRLPTESFFTCRRVSKEWKRIVYHPLVDYVKGTQVELENMSKELIKWEEAQEEDDDDEEGDVNLENQKDSIRKFQIVCELAKKEVIKVTEESARVAVAAASDAADANLIKAVRYTTCGKKGYEIILWYRQVISELYDDDSDDEADESDD